VLGVQLLAVRMLGVQPLAVRVLGVQLLAVRLLGVQLLVGLQEQSLLEILNDPEAGTGEDKLRLIIIAIICDPGMSDVSLSCHLPPYRPPPLL